jgi:iron complex outermembrane receptor protein
MRWNRFFRRGGPVGLSLVCLLAMRCAPVIAADSQDASKPDDDSQLKEIVVTSHYQFLSADTSGATNLPIPIEQVPQSISLVNGDFLKAADLKTLGEIAEYTPGATNVGNQLGAASMINLRGFTAGHAIDGINVLNMVGYPNIEPDNAIYDRLEIVKGPASVVYGVSSPGGLVNYVTKSATPQTVDYLYAQAGSWNSYRLEGQVAAPLDAAGNVRVIGVAVYDQGDSFMDVMHHTTTTLYGGINADLSDSVTGYLHGGYERFVRTAFDGIPTEPNGSPAPLPISFCICASNMQIATDDYHGESDVTWHANKDLDFSLKGNFDNASTSGITPYSQGLQSNGDLSLNVQRLHSTDIDNFGIGLSSIYRFDDLGLKSSFVSVSALYQHSRSFLNWDYADATDTGSIYSGDAAIAQIFESMLAGKYDPYVFHITAKTLTFSAQSVLRLIDPLSVLLGASWAKPNLDQTFNGVATTYNLDSQMSYRAGLIYEFLPRTNAYISYSQSFYPQALLGVGNTVLPPLTGSQYEAGLKYRSTNGLLLLTTALFQINQNNLGEYSSTVGGIDYYAPAGTVSHKGIELSALGQITPEWQINAGYTYLSPKITKDSNAAIVGQSELFLSKQTASVYSTYTLGSGILHGASFGAGVHYMSSQRTAYDSSTLPIPGYALADATVGYTINKWLIQLNAHNIFNKRYFINNYQTLYYGNFIGTPANFSVSARLNF